MKLKKRGKEYYEIYRVSKHLWVRKIKDPMWDVVTMKGAGLKWR